MWTKIYFAVLGLSIAVMAFFTFYSWSWLQSIGLPAVAVDGYKYHTGLGGASLWISFAVLLMVGNVILWLTKSSWAMWVTLVYLAVFLILRGFWLDLVFVRFWNTTFQPSMHSVDWFMAVLFSILAAGGIFIDQFVVVRLREKMYPEPVVQPEEAGAVSPE